ncbi:hypothetical protein D3C86_1759930 [compost metagenome]
MLMGLNGPTVARNTGYRIPQKRARQVGAQQGGLGSAGTNAGQERREKGVKPGTVETVWPTGVDRQRSITTSFAKSAEIALSTGASP